MADSMCGPSNALNNFQKHSTVDRTLQQDRLISRQSPSQGFRSSPGPNVGLLDNEFESFQAGQLPLHQGQGHSHFHSQFAHAPLQQQPGPLNWASDFQRMHISAPAPIQQQPINHQSQQRHDTGGWHQDFARQHGQMGESSIGQVPGQMNTPFPYAPMSGMHMGQQYSGGFSGPQLGMGVQQQQPVEVFDDEAFARAFDEAAKSEVENARSDAKSEAETTVSSEMESTIAVTESTQQSNQDLEMGQDIMIDESARRLMAEEEALQNQERIGSDTIQAPISSDPQNRSEYEDPNALSRTAGELLNSVRHDQSTKFQNSQFLELMRQFRDKQAVVDGDRIVPNTGGMAVEI